jgi:hypothetical protein
MYSAAGRKGTCSSTQCQSRMPEMEDMDRQWHCERSAYLSETQEGGSASAADR